MKVVILAGGFGTRISEESAYKPKPMVEIGGMPILWHIMKEYSYYGFHDFIICAGYKQHMIKEWFADYFLHTSDVMFDFTRGKNEMTVFNHRAEPWKVTVVDTGLNTMTGGRIKRVQRYIGNETFMMTYGDGVCDVDIQKLVAFHRSHGKIATLTGVVQQQQKGVLNIDNDYSVRAFREKKASDLKNRVALVNAQEGAILVSVHQNCLPAAPQVHGAQAFYNGVEGADILASAVQETLNQAANPEKGKTSVRISDSIFLTKNVTAPAVLIECGFLSSPQETERLKTAEYQRTLAAAMAAGLMRAAGEGAP